MYICVECDCLWSWWHGDEMMLILMMSLIWMSLYEYVWNVIPCDVDDIKMRWCWWHSDEIVLMTFRWDDIEIDDVIEMDVCCVCTYWGAVILFGYPWRTNGISLKIISVLGEGRVLLRIFNYPRSMHCWGLCFILHNFMKIV